MPVGSLFDNVLKKAAAFGKNIVSNIDVQGGMKGMNQDKFLHKLDNLMTAESVFDTGAKAAAEAGTAVPAKLIEARAIANTKRMAMEQNWGKIEAGSKSWDQGLREAYTGDGLKPEQVESKMKSVVGGYFNAGTKAQKITRRTAGVAAYAGVNLMGRAINGGTATTNNKGESDIAGIPMF